MVNAFRGAILLALFSAAAALYLPAEPLRITLPLLNLGESVPVEQAATLVGALALTLGMFALPLMGVTAFGLLRFRPWARPLAAWVTPVAALCVAVSLALLPIGQMLSNAAVILFGASASAWALALLLLRSKGVRARFPA